MQGLAAPDPRLLQFGRLHAVSMGVFASCLLVPVASAFWDLCAGRRWTGDQPLEVCTRGFPRVRISFAFTSPLVTLRTRIS